MTTYGTFEWCEGCPMPPPLEADWQAGHCSPVWKLCPRHQAEADSQRYLEWGIAAMDEEY